MFQHEKYMWRALQLARLGQGWVAPNPMVGCVIVHQDRIIGEGWHQRYGESHAEVNAVAAVKDKELLSEATVYVTLEPCSHFGKTPPCADLLIRHQVKRVIVCNVDTNPLVGGKGIARLQAAGIEVIKGVLAEEGRLLNERFFCFMEQKRPFIILKWAESADGFIAQADGKPVAISNEFSRKWVHRWRSQEAAIMVGTRTAQVDNPKLDVRDWIGKNPIRVVIDKTLNLEPSLHLFEQSQPTVVYNLLKNDQNGLTTHVQMPALDNAIPWILNDLYQRNIQSVLVEGGTQLLESFLTSDLWDEMRVLRSTKKLHNGIKAPQHNVPLSHLYNIMGDTLWVGKKRLTVAAATDEVSDAL
ncbi:MAG: bifunctional diaminohydroxyphosphoribosylaminopyrimidine deaminase/5-amino-6-(5-phosphoribosylamino)uracil reductase RibD [Spirosomataceae bacterium]